MEFATTENVRLLHGVDSTQISRQKHGRCMKSSLGTASLRKGRGRAALFVLIDFLGLAMNYGVWTEVHVHGTSEGYCTIHGAST